MTDITVQNNSDSPFDSIRRFGEDGNEYWIARELMKLLGYTNWRRFGANESSDNRTSVMIMPDFVDWQGQYKVNHFEVNENLDSRIHLFFGRA